MEAGQLQLLYLLLLLCVAATTTPVLCVAQADNLTGQVIPGGFSASPDSDPSVSFQPLIDDPAGVFSFGFLRVDSAKLDLAVIHIPSSLPMWRAVPANPATWASSTSLTFNGSLVLSDAEAGVVWSTGTIGDQVALLNTSNLQIQRIYDVPNSVPWQSFDFPSDTLVQDQIFTANATLTSGNQVFVGRLGENFLGLYLNFGVGEPQPIYWKHTALEANAQILPGQGSIYAVVEPGGYLAINQSASVPVDRTPFDSFARNVTGFLRMTLDTDGNLRAYYWNNSAWVVDYVFITDVCGIPTVCGAYGLCSEAQPTCGCLDGSTTGTGTCVSSSSANLASAPSDLCAAKRGGFSVLRPIGVQMVGMNLQVGQQMGSFEDCEQSCAGNCSCWGAIFDNATGYCYPMDYPIQSMVEANTQSLGYFKVPSTAKGSHRGKKTEIALLVVGFGILFAGGGYVGYLVWDRRRKAKARVEEDVSPGPYKDLGSASFRSIELASSNSLGK